jgi:hypothetical protein
VFSTNANYKATDKAAVKHELKHFALLLVQVKNCSHKMKKLYLVAALIFCSQGLWAQSYIVKINRSNNEPEEVTIAINPKNPAQQLAGSNITNVYTSSDSGRTWQEGTMKSATWGVYGDPVVYAGDSGHFFYCHLSQTKPPLDGSYSWLERIVVQKSTDGGKTWNNGPGLGFVEGKVQDKEWICGDFNKNSPHKGNLYVSWTEFDKYNSKNPDDFSRIKFSYSTDGGYTFGEAIVISDSVGDCVDGDNTLEGATPAVLTDGTVVVAWAGHGNIYLDRSTDGGKTFGKDIIISAQEGSWDIPVDEIMRTNGMPFLVADNSGGKYNGNLYLLFGDQTHGDADIMLQKSTDGGKTWSKKMRINNDEENNGKDQFLPHIAIDATNGDIFIIYYDRSHSENNLFIDVYVAYSTDGGETFTHRRITDEPFAAPGKEVFFGDYNGIAAYNGIVRPIWTDVTNGQLAVKTALLSKNLLQNGSFDNAVDYIGIKEKTTEDKVVVHLRLKDKGTFIFKITDKNTGKTFYDQTFGKNEVLEMEIKPENLVLPKGRYTVQVKTRTGTMQKDFEVK